MAHETHNNAPSEQSKSIVSFRSSFWLVVILVGLFISALNFIKVMGGAHEGKEGEKTEAAQQKGEAGAHEVEGPHATEGHAGASDADTTKHENAMEKPAEAPATAEHK